MQAQYAEGHIAEDSSFEELYGSSRMCCLYASPGQSRARRKRKRTKLVMPGAVALPGGHLEAGEQPDEALRRELQEELGIVPIDVVYVCTLLHRSQEFRKLHYFAVTRWQGEMQLHEAEAVLWIPLNALSTLDLNVDRMAVAEYVRVYTS